MQEEWDHLLRDECVVIRGKCRLGIEYPRGCTHVVMICSVVLCWPGPSSAQVTKLACIFSCGKAEYIGDHEQVALIYFAFQNFASHEDRQR